MMVKGSGGLYAGDSLSRTPYNSPEGRCLIILVLSVHVAALFITPKGRGVGRGSEKFSPESGISEH